MKKLFAIIMVLSMLACLVACSSGGSSATNYAKDNKEYFIGGTGPLTGDASSYGISVQKGATLAIEEINAAGGLNGTMFKFDMKDDKAASADAASGYNILYEDGMQISIGSVTSGSCAAFAQASAADNVFFITPSASAANVIEKKNAFRVCFGDPDQGILAARELSENFETIGAIYDSSDDYSSGIFEAFKTEMANLGKDFKTQSFDSENKKDFSTQVEALKDCDVIFLPIYYTEASLIAKTAVAKGSDAVIFGCDGLDGIDALIGDDFANVIKYITPFDVNNETEKSKNFVEAYKAKYNGENPDQFAADGYDAVMVIFEAMKAAGINDVTIDPSTLCDKVVAEITKDTFVFEGATGVMKWEANGACTKDPIIVDLSK